MRIIRLQKQILKSKIHKLFKENMYKECSKYDQFKLRNKFIEEKSLKCKLAKYKSQERDLPNIDYNELLCTHLSDSELKQVSEDINFFIRNKAIKDKIVIFNTETSNYRKSNNALVKSKSSELSNKLNFNAVK